MYTASSACSTCIEWRSASEYTATERTPILRSVRMMRHAIAPRLAIRTFSNITPRSHPRSGPGWEWVVGIARIVQLRTIADQNEDIGFRTHLDVLPGIGNAIFKRKLALLRHWHVHEEIDVVGDIALAHAVVPLDHRLHKAVAAGVHVPFFEGVSDHVAFCGTCPT